MSALLRSAAAWFVEPADEAPPARPSRRRSRPTGDPPRLAVVGSLRTAPPLAAAVALVARAESRAATAVVLLWRLVGCEDPPPGPAAPALPSARMLAARLGRRDLRATARGRVVWVVVDAAADEGAGELRRAEAAAGDVPTVLALARPRDDAGDGLLAERDLVIVAAEPESPLAAAATEDLRELGVPTAACAPLPPGAARLAALAGIAAPRLELPAVRPHPRRRASRPCAPAT